VRVEKMKLYCDLETSAGLSSVKESGEKLEVRG
jgi:hypothetical protein